MDRIIAFTFDIANQKCTMYNALEWHNFIAETRELAQSATRPAAGTLEELFEEVYGDEFWFEVNTYSKEVYDVAFDLCSEEFVVCSSDAECESVQSWAEEGGNEEELFWSKG